MNVTQRSEQPAPGDAPPGGAALRGPWVAAMLDIAGRPTTCVDDVALIRVARRGHELGPATPFHSPLPEDVLCEIGRFSDDDEVITRYAQARAIAERLNVGN